MKQKRFTANDNLIVQVIKNQAGTLGKAMLEGVMNSIDAGAKGVDIELKPGMLQILDDGGGFASEKSIDEFFADFGHPHVEGDAKYGTFRIGRGQLFSFGANVWRTGEFQLQVDINTMGLTFQQVHLDVPQPGCHICIQLYERLTAGDILQTVEEVTRNCKYVDIPIKLNGNLINTPPATCKWTEETDDAFIRIDQQARQTGVDIYQQGVFVENVPSYQSGASGVVCSKEKLQLNTARNQVMRSCPRYKRILAKFKRDVQKKLTTKKDLNEDERHSMLTSIRATEVKWHDNKTMRLLEDVTGAVWSVGALCAAIGRDWELQPDGRIAYSFGEPGDQAADKLMQGKKAIILHTDLLDVLGYKPEAFMQQLAWKLGQSMVYVPLATLKRDIKGKFLLLRPDQLNAKETRILRTVASANYSAFYKVCETVKGVRRGDVRTLRLGISDTADGWTDGSTYIAINQAFLNKCGASIGGLTDLAVVAYHENCHSVDSSKSHVHDKEFYELFHTICRESLGYDVARMVVMYEQLIHNAARKVSQAVSRKQLKAQVLTENEQFLSTHEDLVK